MAWFSVLFFERFVPQPRREELRRQFEQLHQDGMFVTKYEMRFFELACHAVWLVPTDRHRIIRFIGGLTFDEMVNIARQIKMIHCQEREEREAKRLRGSGGPIGVPSGG
ncbi:uncharacterized protein [Nicotiana tomentosiformis]|uniref:uncharacterized protein n=1 Tax=Nicotiana tomentosiformis TaxID=4098 RepID=UPI00388CA3B3